MTLQSNITNSNIILVRYRSSTTSVSKAESVTIRPQTIRLLQIRPKQIRLHAHSTTYKFAPISEIRPI